MSYSPWPSKDAQRHQNAPNLSLCSVVESRQELHRPAKLLNRHNVRLDNQAKFHVVQLTCHMGISCTQYGLKRVNKCCIPSALNLCVLYTVTHLVSKTSRAVDFDGWPVSSNSSGSLAAGTVGTKSTGSFHR